MEYIYNTQGTCSRQIKVELEGDVVKNVTFFGGCDGNLKAIPRLVEGLTIDQVQERLSGITCGMKSTSCGDQLAKAVKLAYESAAGNQMD